MFYENMNVHGYVFNQNVGIIVGGHLFQQLSTAGAQLGNLERGGRRKINNRKDEIIHGLGDSVKCVAPLFRYMS